MDNTGSTSISSSNILRQRRISTTATSANDVGTSTNNTHVVTSTGESVIESTDNNDDTTNYDNNGIIEEHPQQDQHDQQNLEEQVLKIKKDEKSVSKIISRVVYAIIMFSTFVITVYLGHVYICMLIVLIEMMLFRELVRVRYSTYYNDVIKDTIPLFRTTQWLWFIVAIFYTYSDFVIDIIQNNFTLHSFLWYSQYSTVVSFILYSITFIITMSTLSRNHIKFQMNQLCWTCLVLLVTVGQLKYIMHNIFNGLIWYVLPCCLVFTNDSMAYVCGMIWGKQFITRPFINFSPNKTWEGFIGGAICTIIVSWYLSQYLAHYKWMTCPTNEFRLNTFTWDDTNTNTNNNNYDIFNNCIVHPIFLPSKLLFPTQVFELVPNWFVKAISTAFFSQHHSTTIIEICSVITNTNTGITNNDNLILTPCISGNIYHIHHHFELIINNYYPIQGHAIILGLFASIVSPFGGFLASAMKRAYNIKNFDSLIPGHGGIMDRMDCQFVTALFVWVYYNTFIKLSFISVPKLTYLYSLLSEQEQNEFLQTINQYK